MRLTLGIAASAAIVPQADCLLRPRYRVPSSAGIARPPTRARRGPAEEGLTLQLMETPGSAMTGLRRAVAVLAGAAAGLGAREKHPLTDPRPGPPPVLAGAPPFLAPPGWPRAPRAGR